MAKMVASIMPWPSLSTPKSVVIVTSVIGGSYRGKRQEVNQPCLRRRERLRASPKRQCHRPDMLPPTRIVPPSSPSPESIGRSQARNSLRLDKTYSPCLATHPRPPSTPEQSKLP